MDTKFTAGYEPPEDVKALIETLSGDTLERVKRIQFRFTTGPDFDRAMMANNALLLYMLQEGAKNETQEDKES